MDRLRSCLDFLIKINSVHFEQSFRPTYLFDERSCLQTGFTSGHLILELLPQFLDIVSLLLDVPLIWRVFLTQFPALAYDLRTNQLVGVTLNLQSLPGGSRRIIITGCHHEAKSSHASLNAVFTSFIHFTISGVITMRNNISHHSTRMSQVIFSGEIIYANCIIPTTNIYCAIKYSWAPLFSAIQYFDWRKQEELAMSQYLAYDWVVITGKATVAENKKINDGAMTLIPNVTSASPLNYF